MIKVTTSTVLDVLSRLRVYFQGNYSILNIDPEEPLRSELYSSMQMDRHASVIAQAHKVLSKNSKDLLLDRLGDNEKILLEVRTLLVETIRTGKPVTPAAEWLLDNFYLIEEQIVIARKHLPKGYSEALPNLANGVSTGMPRVYDIILEIISHSDGRIDIRSLTSFIAAYQANTILTLGELWGIPIMLRLTVIENLRRIAGKIALDMVDHNLADFWADKMMATVKEEPGTLILRIADMARSKPTLDSAFVAGFTRKLQGKGPSLALPLSWMEQQLSAVGANSSDIVQRENQKQAADQVTVSNSIGTLRFLSATDWRDFVEDLSSVEHVLRRDISGTYPQMDFATRDKYRHVVEAIAKASPLSETEVAQMALALSEEHDDRDPDAQKRYGHIGFYLIGKGRTKTEYAANMRYTLKQKFKRLAGQMPVCIYIASIAFLTLMAATGMLCMAHACGVHKLPSLLFLTIAFISGSTQFAVPLVNWLATIWVRPQLLPRMDFSGGIPAAFRTLVVIPTMLSNEGYIEELIEGLEVRFLANKENDVHFGLLTDFTDADAETLPQDEGLLELAMNGIQALNRKYSVVEHDIFFLFHRSRKWNASERKWMGYERKRGKLAALNAFVRGRGNNEFGTVVGRYHILTSVKYIITLDSDTQLPRDAARKLIATMAHPLNHAIYSTKKRRVVEGYGILQPRVASDFPKTKTSLYLRMQGDVSGIDPYTHMSSDVYQDVFGEGSFIGKGIYDIDIFEQAMHQVFPENRILSHDLLEGCYARAGLLSDVFLYEQNPAQYQVDIKRHHRWIRGDWQIGAWMLPFVTANNGALTGNRLSALSRWKIFDNLRRSLLPPTLLALLLMGWSILPFAWFWTSAVTIIILLPIMVTALWQLIHKPKELTLKAHLQEVGLTIRNILIRFVFGIAVLPYEAFIYIDAIVRTNWRMMCSRKKLLEWTPYASSARHQKTDILSAYLSIWIAPALSTVCIFFFCYHGAVALGIAAPMLILWLLAPAISWYLGKPEKDEDPALSEEQLQFLHRSARKTWAFFEEFVTAGDNWLPPDNFQEEPVAVIAHRTSPTNMGLALLSNLAAYDFGYTSGGEMARRCANTLRSMKQLEQYKGHFYNWYDTLTLQPLNPRYVSTVDSGNLAGHLLTLRQGLISLPHKPIFSTRIYEGLITTVRIVQSFSTRNDEVIAKIFSLLQVAVNEDQSLRVVKDNLDHLTSLAGKLALPQTVNETEMHKWVNRFSLQVKNIHDDLLQLAPWLALPAIPKRFSQLAEMEDISSLIFIKNRSAIFLKCLDIYEQETNTTEETSWLGEMRKCITQAANTSIERIRTLEYLAKQCEQFSDMEYDFLYNKSTSLLRIGYNVDDQRKDDSYYDLLASEARLGIFVAIAQGKLPQESWFALGRLLTNSVGDPILLSWSGSMFEYLMPQLVMPSYENTLLYQTSKATVKRQIEYGGQREVPWGISESAYNMVDANLNYQYRAFGVPGLGLKRGLEEDLVIAPYATMLALMVAPKKASSNLQLLTNEGFEGEYGFYEAIDYTPVRLPRGESRSIIRSYMVHHQGMGLLSLAYLLLNRPMQERFGSELRFQATLLLLQERIPRATIFYAHTADILETRIITSDQLVRRITTPDTVIPEIQLLSNGRYQVMLTNSGGGYSRWKDIAVTRWREDTTRDNKGIFCYVKDVDSGNFWSNTYQPTLYPANNYEAIFTQGHAEFRRIDHGIETSTEIVISPEADVEIRRVRMTNKTQVVRTIEITSYAEIVLAKQASDEQHPAFSNLFVQTEIIPEFKAVYCTRRPRSDEEKPPWMFHLMDTRHTAVEAVSYETDRMQFIGRGRTLADPQAMHDDSLSGKQGAVLDPIVAIRYRIKIKPGQTVIIDQIYGISETKDGCEIMMHKYRDQHLKKRAFELSWTHSQVLLRQINITEIDAQLFDQLAGSVIYANPLLRARASVIASNLRGQSGLWSHSVSGDLPIVLLHIHNSESIELVKQMIQAHAYWQLKGLAVDLVIWNEDGGSYRQVLQGQILGLINTEASGYISYNKPGNIFIRSADQVSSEDRILFESIARIILSDKKGTLSEQVNPHIIESVLPPLLETKTITGSEVTHKLFLPKALLFFNGTGGFTPDGKEYKIILEKEKTTPAPWANVIANPDFGTVISESGSAYTWAINAHEYRLSPWSNDPVSDVGGEAFYLRDEASGQFWSPTPFPVKGTSPYIVTHGFGYSVFRHIEHDISSEMSVFVDKELPIKFIILKITNLSEGVRKLSATGFIQTILGDLHSKTNMHILSEHHSESGALLIRNRYNSAFSERVTFFKTDGPNLSFTADRSEFIGRNRSLENPQALHRKKLSGKTGAGIDPCAALQVKFDLLEGEEKTIVFQLGNEKDILAVHSLILKFSEQSAVTQALQEVKEYWQHVLGAIQVVTPDSALNILANGWLAYQTLACRVFARSGFYQSGGAFGFRDQLQDVLALLHTQPQLARKQILLSASRQFAEGDVQHWWHPPEGRGVRTRCSDDLLWLPFAVSKYISVTGDISILDMQTGFLECRPLNADEDSFYDLFATGTLKATLYEHCLRAIKHSLQFGKHGLPLIGSGDWNDGMDRVGNKGQGESIWLAFFLYDVLQRFAGLAQNYGDTEFADSCKKEAAILRTNIDAKGWDGAWYLRAYFDNGAALGSKINEECRIDAIAQSWSVLSGAADSNRSRIAMASLDKHLVKRDMKLIKLLDPPFDAKGTNPGYIKGYVPGVRENGGQYSHAAIWALMAFAELGEREKIWELFSMIHPIGHTSDENAVQTYKGEPYVMAADVYANETHKGRAGWTWYTGSSGWMYQFIIGSLLGMELRKDKLIFTPCFPLDWPSVLVAYHYGQSVYRITVFQLNNGTNSWWKQNDKKVDGNELELINDGLEHDVEMHISI